MLKILMNAAPKNPWGGPWSNLGDKIEPKNKEQNKPEEKKTLADFDQFFKKLFDRKKDESNGGGGNTPDNKNTPFNFGAPKSVTGLIILGVILFWLSLGFYKVNTDESAVVLYFGKFHAVTTSGLNYHIPYPIGRVVKQSVSKVNTEEFGFASISKDKRNFDAESLMLTGDENIVDIEFQLQWQVSDIKDFVFNIAEPNQTIRKTAESAMREIIARTPIVNALSDGKSKIEQETKALLQQILDSYNAGVRIVLVQLRRVDPPAQVIDAFRDVQTAKADKEKEINEAQAYANDIIPRARGSASQITQQAEAYKKEVVTNAEGEAGRFLSIYDQYSKSKRVTKKRIYLETMEKLYRDTDKIIIDKNAAKSTVTYLPLNESGQMIPKTNATAATK
jgi:membrane protease subunit HflK